MMLQVIPMEKELAVIRLRGRTGLRKDVESTLNHLNLRRINHCTLVEESPTVLGMLNKAKDYITWGPINSDTLKMLAEKRGEAATKEEKFISLNGKDYKPCFRLSPSKGGLGRRGIKAAFTNAGALGDRKDKINDLIKKML